MIGQYLLNGELIDFYKSTKEAHVKTGVHQSGIKRCLCGISTTAGGYYWKQL